MFGLAGKRFFGKNVSFLGCFFGYRDELKSITNMAHQEVREVHVTCNILLVYRAFWWKTIELIDELDVC